MNSLFLGVIIFLLIFFVSPFTASVFLLLYFLHSKHHAVVAVDILDVVIVGAGISGINMGKKLQDIGVSRYTILGEVQWEGKMLSDLQSWSKVLELVVPGSGINFQVHPVILLPSCTASLGITTLHGQRSFLTQTKFRLEIESFACFRPNLS